MDTKALSIVRDYINEHLDITDHIANASFEVYTVWKCKNFAKLEVPHFEYTP